MTDVYKDEFLQQLNQSCIYTALIDKCKEKDSEVITLINKAVPYAIQRTKTVIRYMGEFTLHDSDHLFRVLHLMERIISPSLIDKLSLPELMLLILTAFFHDIGMAPDEKEVLSWKKLWDNAPEFENEEDKSKFQEFKRFCLARPGQQQIIKNLVSQGKNAMAEVMKSYEVTEFIRQTHADRAREIISKDWNEKIVFRDVDLTVELAQLCYSHNEDALSLLELDKNLLCGSGIMVCLPLVGIILRLADLLDFDAKRTPAVLYSHLYVRNPVSINEWNKHRAVQAWEITPEIIQFNAICRHPAIEASIHEFCDMIDRELSVCNNLLATLNEFNKFPDFWERKNNQVYLSWPFPLILIVDICGQRDLDLNSARTEIIVSEKWVDFEEELAFLICDGIAHAVDLEYWDELKLILSEHTGSDSFIRGLILFSA